MFIKKNDNRIKTSTRVVRVIICTLINFFNYRKYVFMLDKTIGYSVFYLYVINIITNIYKYSVIFIVQILLYLIFIS